MNKLETLQQWVEESSRIVFFGGAGVSTESGIPDFRSVDGLYNQKFEYLPLKILLPQVHLQLRPWHLMNFDRFLVQDYHTSLHH